MPRVSNYDRLSARMDEQTKLITAKLDKQTRMIRVSGLFFAGQIGMIIGWLIEPDYIGGFQCLCDLLGHVDLMFLYTLTP